MHKIIFINQAKVVTDPCEANFNIASHSVNDYGHIIVNIEGDHTDRTTFSWSSSLDRDFNTLLTSENTGNINSVSKIIDPKLSNKTVYIKIKKLCQGRWIERVFNVTLGDVHKIKGTIIKDNLTGNIMSYNNLDPLKGVKLFGGDMCMTGSVFTKDNIVITKDGEDRYLYLKNNTEGYPVIGTGKNIRKFEIYPMTIPDPIPPATPPSNPEPNKLLNLNQHMRYYGVGWFRPFSPFDIFEPNKIYKIEDHTGKVLGSEYIVNCPK